MSENSQLKVLFVVTLAEAGGAQRYVADLARNLPRAAFAVAVAAGGAGPMFVTLQAHGIATHQVAHLRRQISPGHDVLAILELRRLFRRLQPDVVHLNSSKAGVLGAIAARISGVPRVVYTAHGFVFNEPIADWRKTAYRWLERLTAKLKHCIICVSVADRRLALQYRIAPAEKLTMIHNGIDVNRTHFLSKEEARKKLLQTYNLQPTTYNLVGTIANFYPTKGLRDLIAAAALVLRQLPQTRFIIMGDGHLRPDLERLIRDSRLEQQFLLPGIIPDAGELLPALDVYCSPAHKEGLPYSLLEAMAAARPIVATAVGGVPEMLGHEQDGLLVPAKDPNAMAAAILRLLSDHVFAERLGQAAQTRVARDFTLNSMLEQTVRCYRPAA